MTAFVVGRLRVGVDFQVDGWSICRCEGSAEEFLTALHVTLVIHRESVETNTPNKYAEKMGE